MNRLEVIATESARFSDILSSTDPAAPVPSCPEWSALDLAWHLTEVHWMWSEVLRSGATTGADLETLEATKPARPESMVEVLQLRERVTAALVDQLGTLHDSEPRWSWWEPDQTVGFTRRMQTYEATMHRVDAELAAGVEVGPLTPEVASGAIDHAVDVMWGWMPDWADYAPLTTVEFVATDLPTAAQSDSGGLATGRWVVELGHWTGVGPESGTSFDEPRARRAEADAVPQAQAHGTAADLALWVWGRTAAGGDVQVSGFPDALDALRRQLSAGMP